MKLNNNRSIFKTLSHCRFALLIPTLTLYSVSSFSFDKYSSGTSYPYGNYVCYQKNAYRCMKFDNTTHQYASCTKTPSLASSGFLEQSQLTSAQNCGGGSQPTPPGPSPSPSPSPSSENYTFTLVNSKQNEASTNLYFYPKDSDQLHQTSLYPPISVNLRPGQSQQFIMCGTYWDKTTHKAGIKILPGNSCQGKTSADGSSLTAISQWFDPKPTAMTLKAITSLSLDNHKEELISSKKDYNPTSTKNSFDISSHDGLTAHTINLKSLLADPSKSSFTIQSDFKDIPLSGETTQINVYDNSINPNDFQHAQLTGTDYSKAFSHLMFQTTPSGPWTPSSPLIGATQTPTNINIKSEKNDMKDIHKLLPGWPDYIAMGTVTDFSNTNKIENALKDGSTINAFFKYAGNDGAGDNGKDPYDIFYKTSQSFIKAVNNAKQMTQESKKPIIPVMVVYTTNASGGDQVEAEAQVQDEQLLTKHLSYLAIGSLYLEKNPIGVRDGINVRGSMVINPDTYGMGNKEGYYKDVHPPINNALKAMLKYLVGKGLITESESINHAKEIDQLFPKSTIDTFKQYNQALNWVVHTFGPNVTYGFADNVWAGDVSGHTWLHSADTDTSSIKSHVQSEANYLINNGVYGNEQPYFNPTFIAFDKYERNTFSSSTIMGNYFYNANDWSVYMQYVSGVSQIISKKENRIEPIMLFQTPGGHIPTLQSSFKGAYGATAMDYILGDNTVCQPQDVDPYFSQNGGILTDKLDPSYGSLNTSLYSDYFHYLFAPIHAMNYDTFNNGKCIWGGHMAELINDHVFSILWGGGSTSSIVSIGTGDNGYLSSKINKMMAAPHYSLEGALLPGLKQS